MEEAYDCERNQESSDSSFEDDIDNVSLLPERRRKPLKFRRRRIRIFEDKGFQIRGERMCSRRTLVYSSITAALLVSVVIIAVFVNPSSSSDDFDDEIPRRRSQFEDELKQQRHEQSSHITYTDESQNAFPWQNIRLPKTLIPQTYRLELKPNLNDFTFTGTVIILVSCDESTSHIFLHSKNLSLNTFEVTEMSTGTTFHVEDEDVTYCKELEMVSLEVRDGLNKGHTYTITVKFAGKLSDRLAGFYKSSYTYNGEKRFLATTHFEPTDARTAFPCFDEPAMKAIFTIVIFRKAKHTALANMPKNKDASKKLLKPMDRDDGFEYMDVFQPSVKMSTYLVAFVVCDYKSVHTTTKDGTLVRVWAPPHQVEQGKFALEEAAKILNYYNDFFGVPYPLPKQAIPDFAAGAMENWGLITYRMTSLLYDEGVSSDSNKQWVSVVVAHELAHQWFGNLVTMKWWDDLWLNEGFASYVENIGVNHNHHDWKMMDQFILSKVQLSMNLDQLSNSHAIAVPVHDPAQINALFDTISYDKGASIIRMLRCFLGDDVFHAGLKDYLREHKFGNARTFDLWKAFEKARKESGKDAIDVKGVMDTWTLQMGFPVLTVERLDNDEVKVSQEHFLIHPTANVKATSPFNYRWKIPVNYRTKNGEPQMTWLEGKEVLITYPKNDDWINLNYKSCGFYRVNYDIETWDALIRQLNEDHTVIESGDRSQMSDDAFNLARAGLLKVDIALGMTHYLKKKEDKYVPWSTAISNLQFIDSRLCVGHEAEYENFKKYMKFLVKGKVDSLGWEDEGTHLRKFLRSLIMRTASVYGVESAVKHVKDAFKKWKKDPIKYAVKPNLRSVIYDGGVRHGDEKDFNYILQKYKDETVAAEKKKLLYALSSTTNPHLLQSLLHMSLDNDEIRSQDTTSVITSVCQNCHGREIGWKFVKDSWKELYKRYGQSSFDFSRLILRCTSHFGSESKKTKIQEFFKEKRDSRELGSAERASKQALEGIDANIKWIAANLYEVNKWFEEQEEENIGKENEKEENEKEKPLKDFDTIEKLEKMFGEPEKSRLEEKLEIPYARLDNGEDSRYNKRRYYDNNGYYRGNEGNLGDEYDRRYDDGYENDNADDWQHQ